MKQILIAIAAMLALGAGPTAAADEPIVVTGCEAVPILGLDPYIRKMCDTAIRPDGTWTRSRQRVSPMYVRSSCGGVYYGDGSCPPWEANDFSPAYIGDWEVYTLTADTIPPGEPGHLDNEIRSCLAEAMRCG